MISSNQPIQTQQMAIRQRQLLQQLGITVWVAQESEVVSVEAWEKASSAQAALSEADDMTLSKSPTTDTYVLSESPATTTMLGNADQQLAQDTKILIQPSPLKAPTITQDTEQQPSAPIEVSHLVDGESIEPDTTAHTTSLIDTHEEIEADNTSSDVDIQAFQLFALIYGNSLILCDGMAMSSEDESALWQAIQQGLDAQQSLLTFPVESSLAQDSASAHAAITGWLYHISVQTMPHLEVHHDANDLAHESKSKQKFANIKRIITLGEAPSYLPHELSTIQMPSLVDMLSQPLDKRQLWQLLRS